MKILQDKELQLRPLHPGDLDFLRCIENDPEHWRYSDLDSPFDEDTLRNYLWHANKPLEEAGQYRWILTVNEQSAGLFDVYDYHSIARRAALGLILAPEFRGRGYGYRGLNMLLDYLFAHYPLHQLYATVAVDNRASQQLFQALGFKRTALLEDWCPRGNDWVDQWHFQLKRSDR